MSERISRALATFFLVPAFAAACAGDDGASVTDTDTGGESTPDADGGDTGLRDADTADAGDEITWHAHVAPLVTAHCASCHLPGGAGPLDFTDPATAQASAGAMLAAVESGRMPPWPPDPDCRTYQGARGLDEDERALLRGWVEGGAALGDPTAAAPLPELPGPPFAPNLLFPMPEPYTPDASTPDDWRCFVLDATFDEETFVRGVDVQPGSGAVHHVLIYAVDAAQVDTILEADADEAGPGYTCFGGPYPSDGSDGGASFIAGGFPTQLGAWVPGTQPEPLEEGVALRIMPGARIVMQVHYNTLGGNLVPDQSTLALLTSENEPEYLLRTLPIADRGINIAAGDAASTHTVVIPHTGRSPVEITTVAAHMHTLAQRLYARILRADDGGEECLLDVPDWDFNWQMSYRLHADDHAIVNPGDSIELTCVYDNSATNQPVVNGEQIEPRDVTWGEGTLDEMCLLYISTIEPYGERPAVPGPEDRACAGIAECAAGCETVDASCLFGCDDLSTECMSCVVRGAASCGGIACAVALQGAQDCIAPCALGAISLGGSIGACLATTCPDDWSAAISCLDPVVSSPACQEMLTDCGALSGGE
jgi:hypothetical protein